MYNQTKKWSSIHVFTFLITLVPVLLFFVIIGNLVWNSIQAVQAVGLTSLLSDRISTIYSGVYDPQNPQYGLLPAMVGTLQVSILTLIFAMPFSMSLALLATEYNIRWIGRVIELLLSVFAGIPPIIYALLSVFVVKTFIQPKFAAIELTEGLIRSLPGLPDYNPGVLPLEQSTLLGSIFLALLIIPFVAPLIVDSIRNVPSEQKEASLALGATRWYTLQRITLPAAMPGIIMAASLGVLKASGDVVISAWTIGLYHDFLPNPLWDVFERNATLSSTGAGIVGGFYGGGASVGTNFFVSNFAALLLVLFAFGVLAVSDLARKWINRGYTL
ncbi:MAG: ABC transporter permease subunit [Chloroflexota bacterium]